MLCYVRLEVFPVVARVHYGVSIMHYAVASYVMQRLPQCGPKRQRPVVQVVLSESNGQLWQLGGISNLAAVSHTKLVELHHAGSHWPLLQRLHREVCTVSSKL